VTTPLFIVARNANDLARRVGLPEPYVARGGSWFPDHEAMADLIEYLLTVVPVPTTSQDQMALDLEDMRRG
jgi:hypothetical protein